MASRTKNQKEVDLLGRGGMYLAEFWQKFTVAVADAGGTSEDIQRLAVKPEGEQIIGQMAALLVPDPEATVGRIQAALSKPHAVTLDYGWSPKTQAKHGDFPGGYNSYYDRMTWSEWQVQPGLDLVIPKRSTEDKELFLFHLGAYFGNDTFPTTEEVLKVLADHGLTPEPAQAIPAIAKVDPLSGREYAAIALGSFWVSPAGGRNVAALWGTAAGRRFDLAWYYPDGRWGSNYRVVVSRA